MRESCKVRNGEMALKECERVNENGKWTKIMTPGNIKFSFQVHVHEYKVKPGIESVNFPSCIHLYRYVHRIGEAVARVVLSVKA